MKEIIYKQDGDKICATFTDFKNLQESPAGFGDTEEEAKKDLLSSTSVKIILTEESSISTALGTIGVEGIKAELQKIVDLSKTLKITDIEDEKQFKIIKEKKKGFVTTRNTIGRAFKSKRDNNTQENKENRRVELEVLEIIETEESRLAELINIAELQKLRKKNEENLSDRREALKKCEHTETDDVLLEMTEKDFEILLTEKRLEYTAKIEAQEKIEEAKIEREKELQKARDEAKQEAKKEMEKEVEEKVEKEVIRRTSTTNTVKKATSETSKKDVRNDIVDLVTREYGGSIQEVILGENEIIIKLK